ncbi:helix-turn-helix transcriptional regulator [Spongiactinospora sp. TRM90649]|uniref:helix-turn-helix domain-containing protein n=1 Tax=Spongiactinospora sp. TRM90649 TaxID=3031114 RepID=UPI0023F77579|nr:helix-turn-helix transcriptional regulator [Spongiactinospora sp. TRM90649]MDF5756468.1 helix-turn-helix transcriptional regulator [Spongiactinospora sp. TRM90649]
MLKIARVSLNPGEADMTVEQYTPQAIWGRELRHYRLAAGLTQAQLAKLIHFSESLISGIETGQLPAGRDFAEQCDRVLNTGGALARLLDWRRGQLIPPWFGKWRDKEQAALTIRSYEPLVVPGLLQTEAYARALLEEPDATIGVRMERQALLTRESPPPPILRCVIDEAILHRPCGDPAIMREQLLHLAGCTGPRLSVQVLPHGMHVGLLGGFALATLSDGSDILYLETAIRGLTTSDPEDVVEAVECFEALRTEALPLNMSIDLIKRTAEERWT